MQTRIPIVSGISRAAILLAALFLAPATHAAPCTTTDSICAAQKAALGTPYLKGSQIRYISDCQTGNAVHPSEHCVQGNDAYDGKSPTVKPGSDHGPWRTVAKAQAWLITQPTGNKYTLAFAQGGVWKTGSNDSSASALVPLKLFWCSSGKSAKPHYCLEIREYPQGGHGQPPTIYTDSTVQHGLMLGGNGARIMNINLVGTSTAIRGSSGIFQYSGTLPSNDLAILNVGISNYESGIDEGSDSNHNMIIRGNHISNTAGQGFFGGSNNEDISYNAFINSGSGSIWAHSIYLGTTHLVVGVTLKGNYIEGAYGGTCRGGPLIAHAAIANLVVRNNLIFEKPDAGDACYGISLTNLTNDYSNGIYYSNGILSNNILINTGNTGIDVSGCPGCLIENNLILFDNASASTGGAAIQVPAFLPRDFRHPLPGGPACPGTSGTPGQPGYVTCHDLPMTNYTVRNNTILYTATASSGMIGIQAGIGGVTTKASISGTTLTLGHRRTGLLHFLGGSTTGMFGVGEVLQGEDVAPNTRIVAALSNTTFRVDTPQNVSSTTITALDTAESGGSIYNNTVTYLSSSTTFPVYKAWCFDYLLGTANYRTIDYNNCYVPNIPSRQVWEKTTGESLAEWQAGSGRDPHSNTDANGITFAAPAPYVSFDPDTTVLSRLFGTGTVGSIVLNPSSPALTGMRGPATDITGAARTAPTMGAY